MREGWSGQTALQIHWTTTRFLSKGVTILKIDITIIRSKSERVEKVSSSKSKG